jgi:IS4 transposase
MTKDEIVKALVEQVVAMGFKIRLITLDAGFYTVDVLNFISQFKYIIAVPVGDVKVYEEFDGNYITNSKRQMGGVLYPLNCPSNDALIDEGNPSNLWRGGSQFYT